MSEQPFLNLLGLARRAGALAIGNDTCMTLIRSQKALFAVVAADTGDNAKKKYRDKCNSFGCPLVEALSKEQLGLAVGKAHTAIVVVTDKGFAQRIRQMSVETFGGEAH